ncbi:ThiF family adenylyltransferase [Spongisporangium articulatum]|uniref:ThiF family adenylyltransferase n=1 Tax=Spongisporangium articulatum TaxID=3362603 RepID=A0ABW8AS48_9ACTN
MPAEPLAVPVKPLVEPGPPLTPAQLQRYARHLVLPDLGGDGQRRLLAARVLVVGAGGLGSPVLQYLAAAGVGTLGVVDADTVDVTNLQRQVVHGVDDVGRLKVDSAASALARVNPEVRVVRHAERLSSANALEVLRGYDLVVDGADNFPTRYLVSDACEVLNLPCVWGSIFRYDGQVSVFWAHPHDGTPGVTYRDLHPSPPAPGAVPSCEQAGVFGAVCGTIGSAMAFEVLKLLAGVGDSLLGRLTVFDGQRFSWRTIDVRADPSRVPVTSLEAPAAAVEAPAAGELTPSELATMLRERDSGERDFVLVDVREEWEAQICAVPGSSLVPMAHWADPAQTVRAVSAGRPVVLYCKSGARSGRLLDALRAADVDGVTHLRGGVLAWIDEIDPAQPRY